MGRSGRHVVVGLVVAMMVAGVSVSAPAQSPTAAEAAIAELDRAAGDVRRLVRSRSGHLRFFGVKRGRAILARPGTPTERAARFLKTYAAAFGLSAASALRAIRADTDLLGMDHVRFQQLHNGVPVTGAEIAVHLSRAGVVAANSRLLRVRKSLESQPSLPAATAQAIAAAVLEKHLGERNFSWSEPRLEVFSRAHLEGREGSAQLAWFFEARSATVREHVWVDARSGTLLLHFGQRPQALQRMVYTAAGTDALPGTLQRAEGDHPDPDPDVNAAYDFSGDTYAYFFAEHGRDSFDGAGAPVISTVHYCDANCGCPCPNAFWNGQQLVYGDGFPLADDINAHEFTHGVIEHSANLFYYMQSGALNESYADIFGESVDLTNGAGNDSPGVRWLIGEDLGVGAFRHMRNPSLYGDPGTMNDSRFSCEAPGLDGGGIHTNSGVPNLAFALMADGGSFNGFDIIGIGLDRAAAVQYRALTRYLLSASDFLDNYLALQQACEDLIGTRGITEDHCLQVLKALDAVEMSLPWPCFPDQAQEPPLCGPEEKVEEVFFDDLENGGTNWIPQVIDTALVWSVGDFFASSGTRHLFGRNAPIRTDSVIEMNNTVMIPPNARMRFEHSFGFEDHGCENYDGGVVEYSINGGPWTDAGSLIHAGIGYLGTLSSCCNNPLANRPAFVRDSFGYTISQLDLSSLAGQPVRFRFRIATDESVDDVGWSIDDVHIFRCVAPPPTLTPTASATATPADTNDPSPATSPDYTPTATPSPSNTATFTETPLFTPTQTGTRTPMETSTETPTSLPTTIPTQTSTSTAILMPTDTPVPCVGDCDGDGHVTINELVRGVKIALGNGLAEQCTALDRDRSGSISIDELIAAVARALAGCR